MYLVASPFAVSPSVGSSAPDNRETTFSAIAATCAAAFCRALFFAFADIVPLPLLDLSLPAPRFFFLNELPPQLPPRFLGATRTLCRTMFHQFRLLGLGEGVELRRFVITESNAR